MVIAWVTTQHRTLELGRGLAALGPHTDARGCRCEGAPLVNDDRGDELQRPGSQRKTNLIDDGGGVYSRLDLAHATAATE